jgi:hypothetical protein
MKNRIKILGIIAIIAVIGFSMAACELEANLNANPAKFYGTWNKVVGEGGQQGSISFSNEGSFTVTGVVGPSLSSPKYYETKGEKEIVLLHGDARNRLTYGYEFSNNNQTLVLTFTGTSGNYAINGTYTKAP